MAGLRINRFIASTGSLSRRKADDLIKGGRITINGQGARLSDIVDPDRDVVKLDGRILDPLKNYYLAMFKPKNMLTTLHDPQGRPCVKDLIPKRYAGVFPVGRLDFDAEGLILLTNDGDLAHGLHHPSFDIPKIYLVNVRPSPQEESLEKMVRGIVLDGKKTRPAKIEVIHRGKDDAVLAITLMQGVKNQIKRMASSVGLRVASLKRISVGGIKLKGMSPGQVRELSASEVAALYKMLKKHNKNLDKSSD
ncbi:MAG TPA: rRNA pseudouridine synthase [Deltaproteobacteria bacterium]|nr:rRNA pseudouridine synthase [Deltaproteobacteria bacterium]